MIRLGSGRRILTLLLGSVLGVASFGVATAQTPAAVATPIAVPTLPPIDPATQAIVRAAMGVLHDIVERNRVTLANTARGRVSYFHRYDLQVQTGTNTYRDVHLRAGTAIDPRGATPATGTDVEITGAARPDGSLDADLITVLR